MNFSAATFRDFGEIPSLVTKKKWKRNMLETELLFKKRSIDLLIKARGQHLKTNVSFLVVRKHVVWYRISTQKVFGAGRLCQKMLTITHR